jgi:hypothetical protein
MPACARPDPVVGGGVDAGEPCACPRAAALTAAGELTSQKPSERSRYTTDSTRPQRLKLQPTASGNTLSSPASSSHAAPTGSSRGSVPRCSRERAAKRRTMPFAHAAATTPGAAASA